MRRLFFALCLLGCGGTPNESSPSDASVETATDNDVSDLFELPRMASLPNGKRARDATAGSLMGAFDFMQTPLPPISAAELSPRVCL